MGKLRSLFKVRRPGNGAAFEKKVIAAGKKSIAIPSEDNSQNSSGKKSISK
jgi:hypothetical protein